MSENRRGAPLLQGAQTVQSIRDTGYKSTDYAIAELIDNSVEAKAKNVLIVVVERPKTGGRRATMQAAEVWVMDDGIGMDEGLANEALSFGGTDRYDSRKGIGRFGMGLPQASVSQCRRTDLWTWRKGTGPGRAHHTFLDLNTIVDSTDLVVPWPTKPGAEGYTPMPQWVGEVIERELDKKIAAGQEVIPSGTVIRWSGLDRTRWVRSQTIREHTEYLLGRIYRRFITGDAGTQRRLLFAVVSQEELDEGNLPEFDLVKPNDPMYQSTPCEDNLRYWEKGNPAWSTDVDADVPKTLKIEDEPPYKEFRAKTRMEIRDIHGELHPVELWFTMAKPEARPGSMPGKYTHQGRHAKNNRGISILRANREIILEESQVQEHTDRWWGVELSFEPELDEIFGVTNNKQEVPYFTQAMRIALQDDEDGGVRDPVEEGEFTETDPIAEAYKVAEKVVAIVKQMKRDQKTEHDRHRNNVEKQREQKKPLPNVSIAVKEQRAKDKPTPGEQEHEQAVGEEGEEPVRERTAVRIAEALQRDGLSENEAQTIAEQYREGMVLQVIERTQSQAGALFWPEEIGDFESLNINLSHPANQYLLDALRMSNEKIAALTEEEAKQILGGASDALGWLLLSWARMELENQQVPEDYKRIQKLREMWGEVLWDVVSSEPFQVAQRDIAALFGADEDDEV